MRLTTYKSDNPTEPYHHAHLWNNCSTEELLDSTCVLNITTVTELVYSR